LSVNKAIARYVNPIGEFCTAEKNLRNGSDELHHTATARMKSAFVLLALVGGIIPLTQGTSTSDQIADWTKSSALIFAGTVKAVNRTNLSSLPATENTIVVRVDKVESVNPRSDSSLGLWSGKQVTVILPAKTEGSRLKADEHAIFFTNPRIYGENIAVVAVGIIPDKVTPGGLPHVMSQVAIAAEDKIETRLQNAIDTADAVITGKVVDVRSLGESKAHALAIGVEEGEKGRPVSEHDPKWQEAIINVESVEKGDTSQEQAIVVFPGSDDVAWVDKPKFQKGEAGTWILHKNQLEEKEARTLLAPETIGKKQVQSYTTLKKEDFHPLDAEGNNQARIRRMIDASGQ
jgi:hypothetical protein